MDRRAFIKTVSAGAVTAGAVMSGAPAVHAAQNYAWKMVTAWPKDFPALGTGANYLARIIEAMSAKRITIQVYSADELVPAFESFDAVSKGTAEMGHAVAYYWKGKHEACQFFAAVPFGLNAQEMSGWLNYGGGQELWDELYAAFNLKPFAGGNTGVQMGGWFNKEINALDDLKGLKMRIPGLGGEVLARAGVEAVNLPAGKILEALQSGAIDAAEWVGPYNDLALGFHKVAKYYYWPGWHEPETVVEYFVNKQAYESLPTDLQEIVKHAMKSAYDDMFSEFTARNSAALVELLTKHKVQLRRFPDRMLAHLGKLSKAVVEEMAARDQMSKKVYAAYEAFRQQAIGWNQIGEQGYSLARTLSVS